MRNPIAILRDIQQAKTAQIPEHIKAEILKDLNAELAAGYATRTAQGQLELEPAKAPQAPKKGA